MKNKINILVLGHTGFVGKSLVSWLDQKDFLVTCASTQKCDLSDPDKTEKYFQHIRPETKIVFCSTINKEVDNTFNAFLKNVSMARNVRSSMYDKNFGGIIFLSSVDIYGLRPSLPITETTSPAPADYYGLAKLVCEHLFLFPETNKKYPVTIFRLPGIYGPNDNGKSIIGKFAKNISSGKQITLYGGGKTLRDYVWISDLCLLIEIALQNPCNGLFNVATGQSIAMRKLIDLIGEIVGVTPIIEVEKNKSKTAAGDLYFDTTNLKRTFDKIGFSSLRTGCMDYIKYL